MTYACFYRDGEAWVFRGFADTVKAVDKLKADHKAAGLEFTSVKLEEV